VSAGSGIGKVPWIWRDGLGWARGKAETVVGEKVVTGAEEGNRENLAFLWRRPWQGLLNLDMAMKGRSGVTLLVADSICMLASSRCRGGRWRPRSVSVAGAAATEGPGKCQP
jgi:hypothetical protein